MRRVLLWLLILGVPSLTTTGLYAGSLLDAIHEYQVAAAKAPDFQPTPHDQVAVVLEQLSLVPQDVLVDWGCGDARVLITAVQKYGCRGIGVEIDPEQARMAKIAVEAAGLADRIQVILGDATKVDVEANVGFAYLWPETLEQLTPRIKKLERFASFIHSVPGMEMKRRGDAWFHGSRTARTVAAKPVAKTYKTERYITGYTTQKFCNGRQCWYQQVPVYGYRQVEVKSEPVKPPKVTKKVVPTRTYTTQRVARWGSGSYTRPLCNNKGCPMCWGPNGIAAQLGMLR